jgi:1,4-alpha-glucan branching enzyme
MAASDIKIDTEFTLLAPGAQKVQLAGNFTNWDQKPLAMRKLKSGQWKKTVALSPGTYEYRFLVDGQWWDDPNCAARVANGLGSENCLRVVI